MIISFYQNVDLIWVSCFHLVAHHVGNRSLVLLPLQQKVR